jgi:hypothetical protein
VPAFIVEPQPHQIFRVVGQGELAAQVVGRARADAKVCADGGDPVLVAQGGACAPAVAELFLLV